MGAKMSMLGLILSFYPYLRSAMVRFPFSAGWSALIQCWMKCPDPVLGEVPWLSAGWSALTQCWEKCHDPVLGEVLGEVPWLSAVWIALTQCWVKCPDSVLGEVSDSVLGEMSWLSAGWNVMTQCWVKCVQCLTTLSPSALDTGLDADGHSSGPKHALCWKVRMV